MAKGSITEWQERSIKNRSGKNEDDEDNESDNKDTMRTGS